MKHCGTKTIETDRLILREFRLSDAEAAYKNWTSDERVTEFLTWKAHPDVAETRRVIEGWIAQYEKTDYYQWAIELKEIGEPIGTISVGRCNDAIGLFHIGYCIGSRWWRRGIMSEAFGAVIAFLFDEVDANRIESQHDPNNPHSGDVMKKCGLKYEGTLRQSDLNNKGIVDACVYGILRSEWKKEKRNG